MSSEPSSLLGKRERENNNNSENNGPVNGFSMMLRPNANIRKPSAKRSRMNIPPAPAQGPMLVRQNAMVPGIRPLPSYLGFNTNADPATVEEPPSRPVKGTKPNVWPPTERVSAMKGTNPKNRSRRISHTALPPDVTTYQINNNAPSMVHTNSQTNLTFERYIVPCLRDKIPDEEIQELYNMYVSLKTNKRGKQANRPDITKESAIIAHVNGIIYNHLASINALNIGENATKNVPPEFGTLPEQQRMDIFRDIGAEISTIYEGSESTANVARIILYALGKFRRYLPSSFVAQVNEYLNKQIMPTTGGKHRSNRKTQRRNKTKRRSTRKN